MPRAGLETANPATERQQTYALDRAATGIGRIVIYIVLIRSVFGVLLIMRELRQFWF
jgi:hypothetical protein